MALGEILYHPGFLAFLEMVRELREQRIKAVLHLTELHRIYREQGAVEAFDQVLELAWQETRLMEMAKESAHHHE
jgi:hypothetical protein